MMKTTYQSKKGFTLIELLIVIAVIAVLAAFALPHLIRSRMSANESSAIGSLKTLASAEAMYWNLHSGYTDLPGLAGSELIDEKLGSGTKGGYVFTSAGVINESQYSFHADPLNTNTGVRHFFIDETMSMRVSMDSQANSSSPVLD
jgi:type IV pilus assembly protein PilA